jgi:hypothetical protein
VDGLNRRNLFQPPHEQFDVGPPKPERIKLAVGAPPQEHLQIRTCVDPRQALVASQVRGDHHPKKIIRNTWENDRICHAPTVPRSPMAQPRQERTSATGVPECP